MKPKIFTCCWIGNLHTGAIVIGWYFVVISICLLIQSFIVRQVYPEYHDDDDMSEYFFKKYNLTISSIVAVAQTIAGVLTLVAARKKSSYLLGFALVIVIWLSVIGFSLATFTLSVTSYPPFLIFLFYSVLYMYLCLVLGSYYQELKDEELRVQHPIPQRSSDTSQSLSGSLLNH